MVELIPKESPKTPRWLMVLFYLSFVLMFVSVASHFILDYYFNKYQATFEQLKGSLTREEISQMITLEEELLVYQGQIKDFSFLVDQHLKTSNIFSLIQDVSHPKVWFSRFTLSSREGIVNLSGRTQSFESLAQQIMILNQANFINDVSLSGVSAGSEGEIDFNLVLKINPKVLQ